MRKLLHFAAALSGIATIAAITSPAYAGTVAALSNSPGTANLAELTTTGLNIFNNTTSTETTDIDVNATDYTQPLARTMTSTLTGSLLGPDPVGDSITLVSCAFDTNVLASNCTGATVTTPLLTLSLTTTSASVSDFVGVSLTAPYSLTQVIVLTLAAGDTADFTAETDVRPTPEPMSAALLASGLVALGWMGRRRRRT